jgi:hypothetical protein
MRIHDIDISAGATILLLIGAANREPRRYPDPNLFDPHRNPTDHAAFGWGIHLCLGAALARLEAKVTFEVLMRHADNVTLTDARDLADAGLLRGVRAIPISLRRREGFAKGHTESLHSLLWPASRTESGGHRRAPPAHRGYSVSGARGDPPSNVTR